jgi:hypothetical protein
VRRATTYAPKRPMAERRPRLQSWLLRYVRPSRSNSAAPSSGPLSRNARLWHRPDFQKVRRAFAAETIRTSARTAAVRVQHHRRSYFSVQSRCHVGGDTTRIPTRTFWFWFCINGIFLRQTEQIVRFARCNSPARPNNPCTACNAPTRGSASSSFVARLRSHRLMGRKL